MLVKEILVTERVVDVEDHEKNNIAAEKCLIGAGSINGNETKRENKTKAASSNSIMNDKKH